MRIIWQGTDSLFLIRFPKQLKKTKIFYIVCLRIFAKLADIFCQEHYACGYLVERNLNLFGMKKDIIQYQTKININGIEKKKHVGINILYYFPKNSNKFREWLYGYDIFLQIKKTFPDYNFIIVDGSFDMKKVYPIIDLLIRPNRHDGIPRMINECKILDIPYIWTNENPTVEYFINKIKIIWNFTHQTNTKK